MTDRMPSEEPQLFLHSLKGSEMTPEDGARADEAYIVAISGAERSRTDAPLSDIVTEDLGLGRPVPPLEVPTRIGRPYELPGKNGRTNTPQPTAKELLHGMSKEEAAAAADDLRQGWARALELAKETVSDNELDKDVKRAVIGSRAVAAANVTVVPDVQTFQPTVLSRQARREVTFARAKLWEHGINLPKKQTGTGK